MPSYHFMTIRRFAFAATFLISVDVLAYEINNHADMSQDAVSLSALRQDTGSKGKLLRLGLKQIDPLADNQRFPLDPSLPVIRYCFGEYLPGQPAREYDKAVAAGRPVAQDPDPARQQPG